jgi:hypothetical protein
VADDDDLVSAALDRRAHVVDACTGCESLVGLRLDPECLRELGACLARPEQRAREDDRWARILVSKLLPEGTRLAAPLTCQGAQFVRITGRSLCVSDEVEAHAARIAAWVVSAM